MSLLNWVKATKNSHKSNLSKLNYEGFTSTLTGTQRQLALHNISLAGNKRSISHLGLTGSNIVALPPALVHYEDNSIGNGAAAAR